MIYYTTFILNDEEGSTDVPTDDVLIETLAKLEESVSRLNENLEKATEEVTTEEVTTEEVTTEEIPLEEQPLQKGDMFALTDSVDRLNDSLDSLVRMEEQNRDGSNEIQLGINYLDETADTHLYLTSPVENATINDIYTMELSIRNVLVLALLLGLSLFFFKLVRTALERMLNR